MISTLLKTKVTAIFTQLFFEMLKKITKFEMINLISLGAHCLYVISTILHFNNNNNNNNNNV